MQQISGRVGLELRDSVFSFTVLFAFLCSASVKSYICSSSWPFSLLHSWVEGKERVNGFCTPLNLGKIEPDLRKLQQAS